MKTHIYEILETTEIKGGGKSLKIREYRKKAGMTQEQLAKKMNVDQTAVSRWETGETKPFRKIHKKLARVLGCTVDDLLKEDT